MLIAKSSEMLETDQSSLISSENLNIYVSYYSAGEHIDNNGQKQS